MENNRWIVKEKYEFLYIRHMKWTMLCKILLNIYKYPLYWWAIRDNEIKELLKQDACRLLKKEVSSFSVFMALISYRNFASVFLYRIKKKKLLQIMARIFFAYNRNIELLSPIIGGGLVLYHNMGAVIRAKSIGQNVSISQGVTIGEGGDQRSKNPGRIPTIGSNVLIATNAVVIGEIDIGDYAVIGAGCVVTKNVPRGAVVVGNPQRIIKVNESTLEEMDKCYVRV